jgi:hypothetical protein
MIRQTRKATTALTCSVCSKSREEGARLPRGWKHHRDQTYCEQCWGERYLLRAIVIPVVSPVDASWEELNQSLDSMFRATTQASNWMVTELAKRDVKRQSSEAKIPRMPQVYLYPEAREQFPDLPPQSIAALEQSVQRKYRSKRYDVIWRCAGSLPTYRYPQPFPVHNQSWWPIIVEDTPQVTVRIAERKYTMRLKGGFRYRRQLASFRSICSGEAKYGELDLYQTGRDLLCKMVAWLPRREAQERLGVLYVRTAPDALLVAFNAKDEVLWRYNGNQVRRWAAEHAKQLQRWSEDTKAEERPLPGFAERRAAARKYHHRLNTSADQSASYLANYAARRKFATVEYDDSDTSYCGGYVWFRLRERISMLLDERGIEFQVKNASVKVTKKRA